MQTAVAPTGQSLGRALEVVEGLREIGVNIFAIADNPGAFANVRVLPIPMLAEEWSPLITCQPLQWLWMSRGVKWPLVGKGWGRQSSTAPILSLGLAPHPGGGERTQDEDQNDGPNEGHEDGSEESRHRNVESEEAKQETTNDGAEDADDDVADEAIASTPDQQARQPTGDQADNQPD